MLQRFERRYLSAYQCLRLSHFICWSVTWVNKHLIQNVPKSGCCDGFSQPSWAIIRAKCNFVAYDLENYDGICIFDGNLWWINNPGQNRAPSLSGVSFIPGNTGTIALLKALSHSNTAGLLSSAMGSFAGMGSVSSASPGSQPGSHGKLPYGWYRHGYE